VTLLTIRSGYFRILATCSDRDRVIVCTHGFMKSFQKTPKKEIEKTEELRTRYFKDKAADSIVILDEE